MYETQQRFVLQCRRVVSSLIAVTAVLAITPACATSRTSIERQLEERLGLESAECRPADSHLSCDVFDKGRLILADCTVYAGPGASENEHLAISGCRRTDGAPVAGRHWDDIDQRLKESGLHPRIGFSGDPTTRGYEAVFDEVDEYGRTTYALFLFRTASDARRQTVRMAQIARLIFGSTARTDIASARKGSVIRRGRILAWHRSDESKIGQLLQRAVGSSEKARNSCRTTVVIFRRDVKTSYVENTKDRVAVLDSVSRVELVSPEAGLARVRTLYPDVTAQLAGNPLPPLLEVSARIDPADRRFVETLQEIAGPTSVVRSSSPAC